MTFQTSAHRWKLPTRSAAIVAPLALSILMTCIVSAISTAKAVGITQAFFSNWPAAWLFSWIVAFPALLAAQPLVRRIVVALVAKP